MAEFTLWVMSNLQFQILNKLPDLKAYQLRTLEKVGVKLPLSYLSRARVLALKCNRTGNIYGGFTMAFEGPLRCLSQLPADVLTNNSLIAQFSDQCFEINGLWLDHKKVPEKARLELYLYCMKEATRLALLGKTKYVYAYCADNEKLKTFYKNFNSEKIYEGPVKILPGMSEAGNECVEMGCMKRLPITVLRNPLFLLKRASLPPKVVQWMPTAALSKFRGVRP